MEDTDAERSSKKYEEAILDALAWASIQHDEGPDVGGAFGPYRQSERLPLYHKFVNSLWEEGKAYPCFLSEQEITQRTDQAVKEKKAPHAYHDHYRNLPYREGKERIERGDSYVMRFKNQQRSWKFRDDVRRDVEFGPDMVGDFIILRSDGMPVYNLSCVIDDILMEITHVIRGEEHLPNTLRQLMLYDALEEKPPQFAHVSLWWIRTGENSPNVQEMSPSIPTKTTTTCPMPSLTISACWVGLIPKSRIFSIGKILFPSSLLIALISPLLFTTFKNSTISTGNICASSQGIKEWNI